MRFYSFIVIGLIMVLAFAAFATDQIDRPDYENELTLGVDLAVFVQDEVAIEYECIEVSQGTPSLTVKVSDDIYVSDCGSTERMVSKQPNETKQFSATNDYNLRLGTLLIGDRIAIGVNRHDILKGPWCSV